MNGCKYAAARVWLKWIVSCPIAEQHYLKYTTANSTGIYTTMHVQQLHCTSRYYISLAAVRITGLLSVIKMVCSCCAT